MKINKEKILFHFLKGDHEEVIKIIEYMTMSYEKDITIFSNFFCKPNVYNYFLNNFSSNNFKIDTCGGSNDCERRIICFNNIYNSSYPYKIIKIKSSDKFQNLQHKDFLGSILSLGILRNKLGDLRVNDNYAVVSIHEDIVTYVIDNLKKVKNSPVEIYEIDKSEFLKLNFELIQITVPSLRIDAVVAKLSNASRTSITNNLKKGSVLLNYCEILDKSMCVKEDDIITISKVGKFKVGQIESVTKKDKLRLSIKKYV